MLGRSWVFNEKCFRHSFSPGFRAGYMLYELSQEPVPNYIVYTSLHTQSYADVVMSVAAGHTDPVPSGQIDCPAPSLQDQNPPSQQVAPSIQNGFPLAPGCFAGSQQIEFDSSQHVISSIQRTHGSSENAARSYNSHPSVLES